MAVTTYVLSFTWSRTTWLPSSHLVLAVQRKSWEQFVLGQVFAIDKMPGPVCFRMKFSSSNFSPYMDMPPVPLWRMKSWIRNKTVKAGNFITEYLPPSAQSTSFLLFGTLPARSSKEMRPKGSPSTMMLKNMLGLTVAGCGWLWAAASARPGLPGWLFRLKISSL